MHYLGLALYGEGPGDYQFLRPILQRLCEDICVQSAARSVDVSEVIPVDHAAEEADSLRPMRVLSAAREHSGAWKVLFVHGDGSGNPTTARANLVQPALDALHNEFDDCRAVGVVPVRESEAWAICDGDALRQVFCTTLTDAELGIPVTPLLVEANLDPKATLKNAFLATNPPPQRKRQGVGSMLNALGDSVGLAHLRRLSSFQALEQELATSLRDLGVLR